MMSDLFDAYLSLALWWWINALPVVIIWTAAAYMAWAAARERRALRRPEHPALAAVRRSLAAGVEPRMVDFPAAIRPLVLDLTAAARDLYGQQIHTPEARHANFAVVCDWTCGCVSIVVRAEGRAGLLSVREMLLSGVQKIDGELIHIQPPPAEERLH